MRVPHFCALCDAEVDLMEARFTTDGFICDPCATHRPRPPLLSKRELGHVIEIAIVVAAVGALWIWGG